MRREEAFLFYKVLVDDSSDYSARSHVSVGLCMYADTNESSFFWLLTLPLPVSLCSLTFSNFCVSSLFIDLFDNARGRVESLFLVGAPDRRAACSRSFPWRGEGERIWAHKGRLAPGAGSLFSRQQAWMRSALG